MYHHAVLHERHVQISWNLASSMEVTRGMLFYNFMCISLILFPIQHYIPTVVMVRFWKCRSAHIADVIYCGMAIRHIFLFCSLVVNWTVHLGLALLWPSSLWLRLSLSVVDTSSAESGEKNSRIYLYKYHWCWSDNPGGGVGAGRVPGGCGEPWSHVRKLSSVPFGILIANTTPGVSSANLKQTKYFFGLHNN